MIFDEGRLGILIVRYWRRHGAEVAHVIRRGTTQHKEICYRYSVYVLVIRQMVGKVVGLHEDVDWRDDSADHVREALLELL